MIKMYIDPGTGSMLFTIIIGLIGAGVYALRNVVLKLRFFFSGGKQSKAETADRIPFAIFTDSMRYWSIFKPICDELEKREQRTLYLTASPDDPLLKEQYSFVHPEFIGEGNKAFARMNMLKADVVLSSTPGLDVYQWKRSRDVEKYVHVLHAANDVTAYRMFGLDYYDAVLLSGKYQIDQLRQLEVLRHLPSKELPIVGLPHMDSLRERLLREGQSRDNHKTTVLLAPSWGKSAILQKFGSSIIDALLKTEYQIIIRPHPQSFVSEQDMIGKLMKQYPDSDRLKWDRSTDNFQTLYRSDILISDFSGVIFDFSLVFDKPIIYADTSFDKGPYDAWWLEEEMWTFRILPKLGPQLTSENFKEIGALIEGCLQSEEYRKGREQARQETWQNIGHSVPAIVDYLIEVHSKLSAANHEDV